MSTVWGWNLLPCLFSSREKRSVWKTLHLHRQNSGLRDEHHKTSTKGTAQDPCPCILCIKSINFVPVIMTKAEEGSQEAEWRSFTKKYKINYENSFLYLRNNVCSTEGGKNRKIKFQDSLGWVNSNSSQMKIIHAQGIEMLWQDASWGLPKQRDFLHTRKQLVLAVI